MREYYNDPEATAKAFAGGWFHTVRWEISAELTRAGRSRGAVSRWHGASPPLNRHSSLAQVSIQDRSKDIIISGTAASRPRADRAGGENASSLAIESALATHPDVFEVAVVARPHERFGERAHAFVVLVPDSAFHSRASDFEKELKDHCASVPSPKRTDRTARSRLPGFARPEWVEVVDATSGLPKTSTGKIQKVRTARVIPLTVAARLAGPGQSYVKVSSLYFLGVQVHDHEVSAASPCATTERRRRSIRCACRDVDLADVAHVPPGQPAARQSRYAAAIMSTNACDSQHGRSWTDAPDPRASAGPRAAACAS